MPPEALSPPALARHRWSALPDIWRAALARLAFAGLLLLALFWDDWSTIALQAWNVSTYNHILLVPAILAWLIWQRAGQLVRLEPTIWSPGLLILAAAAFLWLLGAFSGLNLARQAGVVAMAAATVPLLLGPRVAYALAFPLFYMIFLVPCGEELVTVLQTITARITIALVLWSDVPAEIDGVFIHTPAGLFEVAEACSGVKFLIAMVAFGTLMANACFVSWRRRAALLVACVIVPILANGVRAWGTIYAAQFFGVEAAAGIDHIIYGWVFFGIVIALIIAVFWRFFDRAVDDPMIDAEAIARQPTLARLAEWRLRTPVALAAMLAILLGTQAWAHAADRMEATLPRTVALPAVPGWARVDYRPQLWWEPRASGAGHRLLGSYGDGRGRRIDVFYALYATQREGSEAGGFGEGALTPGSGWAWQAPAQPIAGAHAERLLGNGRVSRVALTWYDNGELLTGSNARLKLAAMADRLALRARPTVLLILSAEDAPGKPAAATIADFVKAIGSPADFIEDIGGAG
jgi:exosortase A